MEGKVEKIDIEKLEEILKEKQNEKIIIELEGMVIAKFDIQNVKIVCTKDFISFLDNSLVGENSQVLSINRHQIMKITRQNEHVLVIEFDAPQLVRTLFLDTK